ncbi:uncharacterized protein N7487_004747 [Penicillium crustosum]|uniref:uncharacterized protein n=1 Tax=Penicillium crustosum TaxID=36656 RepID=UPI00238A1DEE|nr:uncharacterized protein N7487_004747 [Penicillium crustosum]KAJ5410388.1 hypothetical protein N7487_004747 [Penicillium crustosum]
MQIHCGSQCITSNRCKINLPGLRLLFVTLRCAHGCKRPTRHEKLEGHLVGMLLTQLKCCPQEREPSKLNEIQLRLICCDLKRWGRFLDAQQHSRGLDAGPT